MGSAILSGILDATIATNNNKGSPFTRIIACTKSQSSADKLASRYSGHSSTVQLDFVAGGNATTAAQADVVILGCKPYLVDEVLTEKGLCDALAGKLVVSIIAGKTIGVLIEGIAKNRSSSILEFTTVVTRAIPNVAASVRESMTVVELPETASQSQVKIIEWMFSQIGMVKVIGGDLFDCGSMLMASLATVSVAVDGILDGCVAEGMRRADASEMAAQCLLGLAKMLKDGHHPAVLRESISSPRGCTIQGLLAVEKGGVRSAFAESIIAGTGHLKRLQEK
ncbi:pyrroline-5-carboxylate reductase dimerization-domain-containing protein [Aspergillus pseudoustus]|uniref:Pyrroline-5-carboxylate reductase dimerization-domain-containing protein n=1 Tax=Aspergillus pseudoustus TaxID=1810923 RepID=A0ABR4IZW9_9EURO